MLRSRVRLLGRVGKKRPLRSRALAAWTRELQDYAASRRDRDGETVCVVAKSVGTPITSMILLVPPFFRELKKLPQEGTLRQVLVASSDCTFNVEFQGYTFSQVVVQMYRRLCGRWRKSSWPVALTCYPREKQAAYQKVWGHIKEELQRRGLPMMSHMHTDYFPGLRKAFSAEHPDGQLSTARGT